MTDSTKNSKPHLKIEVFAYCNVVFGRVLAQKGTDFEFPATNGLRLISSASYGPDATGLDDRYSPWMYVRGDKSQNARVFLCSLRSPKQAEEAVTLITEAVTQFNAAQTVDELPAGDIIEG